MGDSLVLLGSLCCLDLVHVLSECTKAWEELWKTIWPCYSRSEVSLCILVNIWTVKKAEQWCLEACAQEHLAIADVPVTLGDPGALSDPWGCRAVPQQNCYDAPEGCAPCFPWQLCLPLHRAQQGTATGWALGCTSFALSLHAREGEDHSNGSALGFWWGFCLLARRKVLFCISFQLSVTSVLAWFV